MSVAAAGLHPAPPGAAPLLQVIAGQLPSDGRAAVALLRRHGVPTTVVDTFVAGLADDPAWQAAVAADVALAGRLARAAALLDATLGAIEGVALAGDSLGPPWPSQLEVLASREGLVAAIGALKTAGFIRVDRLRAGGRACTPLRYIAVHDETVLAAVEVSPYLWPAGPPAADAVHRATPAAGLPRLQARDAAARRVAILDAESRPTAAGALALAALDDAGLAAAGTPLHRRYEAAAHHLASGDRRTRPRRPAGRQLRVAFCGIDGSGKSTQARLLAENLTRAGVPACATWTRIGNGASAPVTALASLAQRVLPSGTHSFQAVRIEASRAATTGTPAKTVTPPLTRRGVLGWSWATAVTLDYLCRLHAARLRAGDRVLVLDRALPDALVELQDDYGIVLRLGFQRRLLRWLAPRPHRTFYLRLSGASAKQRKDDVFTAAELDAHIALYEDLLAETPDVTVLDARAAPDALALEVLHALA